MTLLTSDQQAAFAADLRRLADIVDDNAKVAEKLHLQLAWNKFLVPLGAEPDPVATMQEFIRVALDAGLVVRKSYDEKYGQVDLIFPSGLDLHVYAQREQVCVRRVVGTREVTEEVPDPDAIAAVPTVTVTKTVEDVEWDCLPLLAPRTREEEMADAASDGFLDNADPEMDAPGADDYLTDVDA